MRIALMGFWWCLALTALAAMPGPRAQAAAGDDFLEVDSTAITRLPQFWRFQRCFTGRGPTSVDPGCATHDFPPSDSDVDLYDYCRFHAINFGEMIDADGDTIPDRCDVCRHDPQNDADQDGVCGDIDTCPNSPPGKPVDLTGCSLCGNTQLDPGEECEPPNTSLCDENCLLILAGKITADVCADSTKFGTEGTFRFQNRSANTDGPPHTSCIDRGEDQIEHDLWMCWSAPCDGTIFVSSCFVTDLDTKVAVYDGCACPVSDARLRTCNDNGCGPLVNQSQATFEAVEGHAYLVRVGTFPGAGGGLGSIQITCGTRHCPDQGSCLTAHDSPGCGVESCCESVCAVDPFCCSNRWDPRCANEAAGLCTGGFPACEQSFGSCALPDGLPTPGCEDTECCNAVCQMDPFCCIEKWDHFCADREPVVCRSACVPGRGTCFAGRASPGCDDDVCCAEVCPRDPYCCQTAWDAGCADLAEEHCR